MIFVPDMGCPPSVFQQTVDSLKNTFTCHLLSIAGFAGTPPSGSDHLLEHLKNDLVFYIRDHGLQRPVLIGHGYGALAGLWMAAQEPELPGGLVVIDALPFQPAASQPDLNPQIAAPVANRRQQQLLALTPEQFETMQRQRAAGLFTDPLLRRNYVDWMKQSDRTTLAKATFEFMTLDLREQLYAVTAPVLVLVAGGLADAAAEGNLITVFQDQYRQVHRLHMEVHDTARHFIMLDDPTWFRERLLRFVALVHGRR